MNMIPEIAIMFAVVMSYGTLLAMFLTEKRLRKAAERREEGYKQIAENLKAALERQSAALQALMDSRHNAGGMARGLAAQNSESSTKQNG